MAQRPTKAESAAGLSTLRSVSPGAPMPGAAQALPGRVHGRYAVATVGAITLHLFDWEISFSMEVFDATAHGEFWKVRVPGDQEATIRCKGYFTRGSAAYFASAMSTTDPAVVAFSGYETAASTGTAIFACSAFITRANFAAPMAMVTQEIELTSTGAPSLLGG